MFKCFGKILAIHLNMGRPLRVIQTELPYHLVCRTNNRTFRFDQKRITRIFFQTLKETHEKYKLLIHHVVLMSNHYHIVATATEENLHRAMQYFNSRVAVRFNKSAGRSGHLWGDRYESCIIDTDEYYLACLRYIYRNPKRAGLVDNLEDFEDSSFQFWAFGKKLDVFLVEDHLILSWNTSSGRVRDNLRYLVLDEGGYFSDEEVKRGLRRMFFGSADFIKRMQTLHCYQA